MNTIKLSAIDSTNRFLKDLAKKSAIENFTIVTAEEQLAGKGQMDTVWHSQYGKNLLFTMYAELKGLPVNLLPYINFLVSATIRNEVAVLLGDNGKIKVKWPNDIMSYNNKICGILIENSVRNTKVFACYIGVGLNINQINFPDYLPKVSSLAKIKGDFFNRNDVLQKVTNALSNVLSVDYIMNNLDEIKQNYLHHLYKINTPCMFKDKHNSVFMAKIIDVNNKGCLLLEKENEQVCSYAVKEIKLL